MPFRDIHQKNTSPSKSRVRSALDLAFNVVALAEEREPVVEHLLVLIREVRPIGTALLRLERRLSESARSVLAGEDLTQAILLVRKTRRERRTSCLDIPLYEPSGPYALLPVTSKTVPLMAT